MSEQGARTYTPSVYLSVTDDANRWRAGPPQPHQLPNQSKVTLVPDFLHFGKETKRRPFVHSFILLLLYTAVQLLVYYIGL